MKIFNLFSRQKRSQSKAVSITQTKQNCEIVASVDYIAQVYELSTNMEDATSTSSTSLSSSLQQLVVRDMPNSNGMYHRSALFCQTPPQIKVHCDIILLTKYRSLGRRQDPWICGSECGVKSIISSSDWNRISGMPIYFGMLEFMLLPNWPSLKLMI